VIQQVVSNLHLIIHASIGFLVNTFPCADAIGAA
jgi:hypothetical protein